MADVNTAKFPSSYTVAVVSLLVCILLQALWYIRKLRRCPRRAGEELHQTQSKSERVRGAPASGQPPPPQCDPPEDPGQRHHQRSKRQKQGQQAKSAFSHRWLLANLKGHSGQVQDMDYSSNGKYLATCADGPEGPEGAEDGDDKPRLSRRQKKNRTRREEGSPGGTTAPNPASAEPPPPAPLPEAQLERLLRKYVLRPDQLLSLGYPVESALGPTRAVIYRCMPPAPRASFDVNAPEFVPAAGREDDGHDSGRGSAESGDSGESSPRGSADSDGDGEPPAGPPPPPPGAVERSCARCGLAFLVSALGEYASRERCLYHWGRAGTRDSRPPIYECCGGRFGSRGCSDAPLHVWSGTAAGLNGPYEGYVKTRARRGGVYALDAEMVYGAAGLQLARVAVVGADGRRVYEATVRPEAPVVDYNTRFSGVRARDVDRATKTLRDVQNDLMGFIGADTTLVGHGLENDLRALRLLHGRVVDTAAVFPHWRGLPWRRSLRSLAAFYLGRDVQPAAHSPLQDSLACLHLVLWRAHADLAAHVHRHSQSHAQRPSFPQRVCIQRIDREPQPVYS